SHLASPITMHTSDHLLSAYLERYAAPPGRRKGIFRAGATRGFGQARGREFAELDSGTMEQDLRRTWDEELRSRGYRVTPQRQLVLEAVAKLDHATPDEIAASVQETASGVNISTIYRTLE